MHRSSQSQMELLYLIGFMICLLNGAATTAQKSGTVIGAIIDANSRIGKEEKTSMEIAIQNFNALSSNNNNNSMLVLHVMDSGGKPLQASAAADYLVKEKQVEAIVGMDTWAEAALVAETTISAQVPVLSFSTPSITPPFKLAKWPYLTRMANNGSLQMQCIASIVSSYGWRKVIAIYENDGYTTDSGILSLLSDALLEVGSEIDYKLGFPSLSTLSDPKHFIQQELEKLNNQQSRVFIMVGLSFELASHILTEAKPLGLMGKDSVWITSDTVTNLFDTVNWTALSSFQGVIGVKAHYSETSQPFIKFSAEFRRRFRLLYPQEDKSEPGIYALRAYDSIFTLVFAANNSTATSRTVLGNILSSNFEGLSRQIKFENGELSPWFTCEIVNVVGKSYNLLKLWSPEYGFSGNVTGTQEKSTSAGDGIIQVLGSPVYWPGKLERVPLGWVMPSDAKPMVIGIPGRTSFEKFVKVEQGKDPTGFCIDVFKNAVKLLNYDLPHVFVPFNGLYNDLVDQVYLKNFDAVVGDITILRNRSNYVEFTQPYAESGLTMVVPVNVEGRAWLFVKPFNGVLWAVLSLVFGYTMFVVWFLEHRSNPDFRGPWKHQLSTTMWFTVSSIFFAQRETLRSNYTRVVMFVWLFTVFVITSSYTASLTSMLTVQRLVPTVTNLESLRRSNSRVGCDGDSFVRKYIEEVLLFNPNNVINIKSEYDYPGAFEKGEIEAALLELPYERVFLARNFKGYQDSGLKHRFGGLGFAFPKGSPMATDFSKAFLKLSEDGTLNRLDQYWFKAPDCSDDKMENQSLNLSNFWGLFVVTGSTSTVMLILYILHLCRRFRSNSNAVVPTNVDDSVWNGIKRLGIYYDKGRFHQSKSDPVLTQGRDAETFTSSNEECTSVYNTPGHPSATPPTESHGNRTRVLRFSNSFLSRSMLGTPETIIETPETHSGGLSDQVRVLRLCNSFPSQSSRIHAGFDYDDPEWTHVPDSN